MPCTAYVEQLAQIVESVMKSNDKKCKQKEGQIMCKRKQIWLWVVALTIVSVLLASTAAIAQSKGKGRGEKPAGWLKGEKEGWKGGAMPPGLAKSGPPGWAKWSDEKKTEWQHKLREAKEKVRRKAKKAKGFSKASPERALLSLEMAARAGVPIKHAGDLVEKAMEKGIRGRGIETATRAMAYGVGKEIDFDRLGKFVRKKLDQGLRGDDLAMAIHKEIERRHEERLKAKETIQREKKKEN